MQNHQIKESEKTSVVCLLFHKEVDGSRGKAHKELKARQCFSVQEFEEMTQKDGFFDRQKIDYEIIHDPREITEEEAEAETEVDSEEEGEVEKAKRGRKPKYKEE